MNFELLLDIAHIAVHKRMRRLAISHEFLEGGKADSMGHPDRRVFIFLELTMGYWDSMPLC